ncbi:unnamed protein product [Blepharisma stoltei]|uniref:Eukaryotic translation initiation factor 5B n=1 Tax=Blepharisma stoltei TaxID=1481888 RepID=A0AAU9JIE0_9CILI|nr:unnamed protein product [Blepharisma stoltei]
MESKKKTKQGKGKKPSNVAKLAMQARIEAEHEEEEKLQQEALRKQKEAEEELKRQEEERHRQEEIEKRKKERKEKKQEMKRLGLYRTPQQIENDRKDEEAKKRFLELGLVKTSDIVTPMGLPDGRNRKKREQFKPKPVEEVKIEENKGEDVEDDLVSEKLPKRKKSRAISENSDGTNEEKKIEEAKIRYKAPIVCILGHVDTGKTKLLDKIRRTNVQASEAGGITQQIGATMFPADAIETLTQKLPNLSLSIDVPGLLIIDTPGHESFSNLRSRGSSLCNIGILVVDIMHGLENQTIESLSIFKTKNIPFIVALNKIDRLYEWSPSKDEAFLTTFNKQSGHVQSEFMRRAKETILEFNHKGYNAALYYENPDPEEYISLVPTSAITGEGIPDMLGLILNIAQTKLRSSIIYQPKLEATVMEVKTIEGLGTTIDVILMNGVIKEDDNIIVSGFNGPISTRVRALLTPMPLREMRVKGEYLHHKALRASMGVKISAQGLDHTMAGSPLFIAKNEEEIPRLQEEVQKEITEIFKSINNKDKGVHVQASTVGSLEALLEFLKQSKIPVSSINIGPVFKKDIMKAQTQIEKGNEKQYATVMAFDVKITPEAQEYADSCGVKIISDNIIFHLFDRFTKYVEDIRKQERLEGKGKDAVFPCLLKIVEIVKNSDPITLRVDVVDGVLKVGTPLCIHEKEDLIIGKVESIELNDENIELQRPGQGSVVIKLKGLNPEQDAYEAGRDFEEIDELSSWITRESIDLLKDYYRDEMTMNDWKLVKAFKIKYEID